MKAIAIQDTVCGFDSQGHLMYVWDKDHYLFTYGFVHSDEITGIEYCDDCVLPEKGEMK